MTKTKFKEIFLITLGVILVAISIVYFFKPNNIAAGGVSGLAIIINNYIPKLPVGIIILLMDFVLFVVGFIFIGRKFGGKSIYASLMLSFVISILETYFPYTLTNDLMLSSIFGTLTSAVGIAIVFNNNASTGGTDIIAKILNKFFDINIGKSLLFVDFFVTLLGVATFGLNKGLYAIISVILNGIAIDKVIDGFNGRKELMIISEKNTEISKYIIKELERGCTFLKGVGAYSNKDSDLLYTILGRSEFIKLKKYIIEIDKKAFISVGEVHEVLGDGFKSIE